MDPDFDNPYAAPSAKPGHGLAPEASGPLMIMGKDLLVPDGTTLPPLCVKTGQPVHDPAIVKKFYSAPNWVILTVLISPLLLLILYYIFRRKAKIAYYLDGEVRSRARNASLICGLVILAAIGAFVAAGALEEAWPILIGLALLLIVAPAIYFTSIRTVYSHRVENGYVWLRGVPPQVLTALVAASRGEKVDFGPFSQPDWLR